MLQPLPIDSCKEQFTTALAERNLVVTATTGSGKSTRLPIWSLEQGATLVIEPRRVACTALASFLAEQDGSSPGERIGYAIRFDHCCSDETPLAFVTPGIALRWLAEGRLERFQTIILDEFHERRWDTDLLLALLRTGTQHRLVVTSATIATDSLSRYLKAEVLSVPGKTHPVSISWEGRDERAMPDPRDLAPRVARAVNTLLKETSGHILVFLPGRGEINQARAALGNIDAEVYALHASAPAATQRAALSDDSRQRVILATNVAETSLTIPGVTAVIDSGLERRTHQRNGRTVLGLSPISRASADQRKGRAGRTEPGRCLRLWGEHAPLADVTPPEIQREELTELVLAAACSGHRAEDLSFADPLPEKSLTTAKQRLQTMGALDDQGQVTHHGQTLFSLPIDSFFAHLISAMPDAKTRGDMVDLTAALQAQPRLFRLPEQEDQRQALQQWCPTPCDATTLIMVLRQVPPQPLKIDANVRKEAQQLARQMRRSLELPDLPAHPPESRTTLLRTILSALPELAFVRRTRRRHAMGNGQREVTVSDHSRMGEDIEAALVLDDHSVPGKQGHRQTLTIATCLAPIPLQWLAEAELGEIRLNGVTLSGDGPVVTRERLYAERVIDTQETVPGGGELRQALAELILRGDLLAPAGEKLREDLRQWSLYVAMGHAEGEVPETAEAWLINRLAQLGVEEAGDEILLEPDDLVFEGIPEWEREEFDRRYPALVSLGDLVMDVTYEPKARRITLDRRHGTRKAEPKRWELPAWKGWKVRYRRGSRVVDVL